MRCSSTKSTQGEDLLNVHFERASPDPAQSPTIRVVFAVHHPEGPFAERSPVLVHLSSNREDTNQAEILTTHEFKLVYQTAAEFIAEV